jgi:hypothetical protein
MALADRRDGKDPNKTIAKNSGSLLFYRRRGGEGRGVPHV